jgi:hypothetical protein
MNLHNRLTYKLQLCYNEAKENATMVLVLKCDWEANDGTAKGKKAIVHAGRHEVERVPNPFGHKEAPWLVLKGTLIGATEAFWRDWGSPDWGDNQIIVEDDPAPAPTLPDPNPVA